MAGVVAALPGILELATPIVGTLLAGSAPDAPSPQAAPEPPALEAIPEVPEVADVSQIEDKKSDASQTESARLRAQKRRAATEDRRLFSLSQEDDSSTVITKSLLGGN